MAAINPFGSNWEDGCQDCVDSAFSACGGSFATSSEMLECLCASQEALDLETCISRSDCMGASAIDAGLISASHSDLCTNYTPDSDSDTTTSSSSSTSTSYYYSSSSSSYYSSSTSSSSTAEGSSATSSSFSTTTPSTSRSTGAAAALVADHVMGVLLAGGLMLGAGL